MCKRIIAVAITTLLLAGCGGGSSTLLPGAVPGVKGQASLVATSAPGRITHVVILIQENRTLDNLFNGFPGADTVMTGKDHNGNTVPLKSRSLADPEDPSHSYQSLLQEYDNGKMDGFDLNPVSTTILGGSFWIPKNYVYGYVPKSESQIYWQLASEFALADRMFSTEMAPSFPGHLTLIGGQSNRIIGDPTDWNPEVNAVWGCDSPSGSVVDTLNAQNQVVSGGGSPCTDFQTLGDMADAKGVSWKYYSGWTDGLDLDGQVSAYDAISHIRYGSDWNSHVPQTWDREYQFFDDVSNGELPAISWLTPPALSSDHAGTLSTSGPDWIAHAITAIETSQYASSTAIVVTWDDAGGWYDHVTPPAFNGLNYGFRVPLIVISPYTKKGYVSHVTHDFGSILHFAEAVFGLNSIGPTDANADDLSDMFDFTNLHPFTLHLAPQHSLQQLKAMHSTRPVDDDK